MPATDHSTADKRDHMRHLKGLYRMGVAAEEFEYYTGMAMKCRASRWVW